MSRIFKASEHTFWMAHSDANSVQSGELGAGKSLTTGQTYFETYSDRRTWLARLREIEEDYDAALWSWIESERLKNPKAKLAHYRWQREVGGLTLPNGVSLVTTRESQAQITATVLSASLGVIQMPVRWKAQSGWVELSQEQLTQIAADIAGHVRACFAAEEVVEAMVTEDPALDVIAAFEKAYAAAME